MQNYRYVFERPLLILAAIGAIGIQGNVESIYFPFLPFILSFLLLINLWFTANRLRSSARIAAYIQVVLEPPIAIHIGWERSLRMYRMWMKKTKEPEREKIIKDIIGRSIISSSALFYPPIHLFHVVMVSFALIISIHSYYSCLMQGKAYDFLPNLSFFSTLITSCIFYYYCFGENRPGKIKNLIERDRAIWFFLFNDEVKKWS